MLLTKAEFLATLKYNVRSATPGQPRPAPVRNAQRDLHRRYAVGPIATLVERQQAIDEFLRYALTFPEVRVVSTKSVLDWIRNPVPLN